MRNMNYEENWGTKIFSNFIKGIPQMIKNEIEIQQQMLKNIPQLKNWGNTGKRQ